MDIKITIKQTIECFLNDTIQEIMHEYEVPKCNFIFSQEAFKWFDNIINNTYQTNEHLLPNIKKENIDILKNQNDPNCPTLYIKDHIQFFSYLTDIVNSQNYLYMKHGRKAIPLNLLKKTMRRIWLRMGVNDFNNVESFLKKQLEFLKDETFDEYRFETDIDEFYKYRVTVHNTANFTWDESTRGMKFKIYDDDNWQYHNLPHIFYNIVKDTCYIYAVQNDRNRKKSPKIERTLYKLNKGIENPTIHPSMVYSMKLFIKLLKDKGINTIKIPTLQVLSYRYHEIMSKDQKEKFINNYPESRVKRLEESNDVQGLKEYELAKQWYNNVVDKEDTISRLKTENLINLVYRITSEDTQLQLISDIDLDDSLIIKINNKVKKKK